MKHTFLWRPLISDALFKKYSFLEFYTFDGGGGFINRALLNSVKSDEITNLVLEKNILSDFGDLPYIDFKRFERWRSIEKSCWINRCYFLPALAQHAWNTNDKSLADMVKNIMLNFFASCPPPDDIAAHWARVAYRMEHDYNRKTYEEYSLDETDVEYIWYDFQPASRVINFLHSLYFILDIADFKDGEFDTIISKIREHGSIIYQQELALPDKKGNHQSIRQIALLHAAAVYPDLPESEEWRSFAFRRGEWHAVTDFFVNGTLAENAPSYHAFETWHGRDLILMAERFGHTLGAESARRLRSAGDVLNIYRRPDGFTLTINDAYPLASNALLESMGMNIAEPERYALLEQGGLAVFNGGKFYTALDVSNYTGRFSHYHAGKNAFILYYDGEAFIDDPGCSNYDDPRFRSCKQGDVHSSLLVDGAPDAHSFSVYGFDKVPELNFDKWQGSRFTSVETSEADEWQGVKFERSIECSDSEIILTDVISADREHEYTLLFTMSPAIRLEIKDRYRFLLKSEKNTVEMILKNNDCKTFVIPAVSFQSDPSEEILQLRVQFPSSRNIRSVIIFKEYEK